MPDNNLDKFDRDIERLKIGLWFLIAFGVILLIFLSAIFVYVALYT